MSLGAPISLLKEVLGRGIKHLPGCRPWKKPGTPDHWLCSCGAASLENRIREELAKL